MREVLISIQPKWVSPITLGKKTVECRKNKPNCELPFKCYIYCTKNGKSLIKDDISTTIGFIAKNGGKVIGEFVCDRIDKECLAKSDFIDTVSISYKETCVSLNELSKYLGAEGTLGIFEFYAWHITDLVVYDEPRELSEFSAVEKKSCPAYLNGTCLERTQNHVIRCEHLDCEHKKITRAPQSWQFCVATEPRQTAD